MRSREGWVRSRILQGSLLLGELKERGVGQQEEPLSPPDEGEEARGRGGESGGQT